MPRRVEPKSEVTFRSAKARAKPYLLADGNGLALRIWPNGGKTWLFRYRRPGTAKENFLSLGPYPAVSLVDARKAAAAARNLVREGTDPVEHRRAEAAARKRLAEGAFHLVAQCWLAFKQKEWADETYRKAESVVREYLSPSLRNKAIATLTPPDIKPLLEAIASHAPNLAKGAPVHRRHRHVCHATRLARRRASPYHCAGSFQSIKRDTFWRSRMSADIAPLVRAINSYSSPVTRAALKLAMLTALRPGVVASAPWEEIDLKAAERHIPANRMKTRRDHIVPLPKQAVAVLRELQALTGKSHYVFPSPARQKTPHLHRDALSKALRDMGFQGKHGTHGFRGMLRTVGRERLGIDIDVLEAQLAHAKRGDVQKAYDRTTFDDERRRVMQESADYIDRQCETGTRRTMSRLASGDATAI
nr:integrase arm-type DNA-binding domain-containing protein [Burkholderia multivorans]